MIRILNEKDLHRADEKFGNLNKRVTNLEQAITPAPFETDDSTAYAKFVPANVLPYAEVNEIGGAARACTNLLDVSRAIDSKTNGSSIAINNDQIAFTYGKDSGDYFAFSCWVDVCPNTNYNLSCKSTSIDLFYVYTDNLFGTLVARLWSSNGAFNSGDNNRLLVSFYSRGSLRTGASETISNIMLNEGSTALPYEPYFDGLISAPVTEVKSVGKNLFDESIFFDTSNWVLDTNFGAGNTAAWLELGVFPAGDYVFDADCKRTDLSSVYLYVQTEDIFGTSSVSASIYQNSRPPFERRKLNLTKPTRLRFWTYFGGLGTLATYVSLFENIRIVRGTTEEENIFEPYKSVSLPIPEALRDLEGYGLGAGTVGNTIDFGASKYTRRVGIVDLGTLTWYYSDFEGKKVFSTYDPIGIKSDTSNTVCAIPFARFGEIWNGGLDNVFFVNNTHIRGVFTQYTDVASFKAAMSGVMLVYELAEPIIEDISDILPLDNYIEVFENGMVYFENEHILDVPSSITYQIKEVSNES